MDFREFLKTNLVFLDGGMGTLLQSAGLTPGEHPERWNITHPEVIRSIHKSYFDAGSNVVCTNTFGANILKFDEAELGEIITALTRSAPFHISCLIRATFYVRLSILHQIDQVITIRERQHKRQNSSHHNLGCYINQF